MASTPVGARVLGDLFDVLGTTVHSDDVAIGVEGEPEFGRDHDLSGERASLADQFFVVADASAVSRL